MHNDIAIKLLSRSRKAQKVQGTTLPEALIAIVVVGVLGAIAAPNILAIGSVSLNDTVNQVAGQLKSVRAKAVAQTTMYRIRPTNLAGSASIATCKLTTGGCLNSKLIVERLTPTSANPNAILNTSCSTDDSTIWVRDNAFTDEDLTLDSGTTSRSASGYAISRVQVNSAPGVPGDSSVLTDWQLCFNPRGVADKDLILTITQANNGKTKRLEAFPGGTVQVYDN